MDNSLFQDLARIIDQGKNEVTRQVNSTLAIVFWQVGYRINTHILNNQRAEYGRQIVPTVSAQLKQAYGKSFEERNLRRIMQFVEVFPDIQIVSQVATQLSYSKCTKMALWSLNTGPICLIKPNLRKSCTRC
ncbi:MAG: DUF1016 N-terminal domain-containing protein [Prolixibacteraceae bacterium]|jgi:hypothetical protein|nr:DUF1016 N-terminal domain-containing protein [Prolixibacteraceae bacterium]